MDHKNKIENQAKRLVNEEGLLVHYEVKVTNIRYGEDARFAYVNSDFDCELATYATKNGELVKSDRVKTVSIKSRYREKQEAEIEGETDQDQAAKTKDFDKDNVKLAYDPGAKPFRLDDRITEPLRDALSKKRDDWTEINKVLQETSGFGSGSNEVLIITYTNSIGSNTDLAAQLNSSEKRTLTWINNNANAIAGVLRKLE